MTAVPEKMKAVYIEEPGDVTKLIYGDVDTPQINADQVLIKVNCTSVNFIDTYHRTGLYKLPLPAVLGRDGAGLVVGVGANVVDIKLGDRVAFVFPQGGSYAEYCAVHQSKVVTIPSTLCYDNAVAMMLQGLTAHYLVTDTYPYKPGDYVLVHAGAGGTGSMVIQIAKAKGLKVITTVSSTEKAEIVKKLGADHVIVSTSEDIYARVMEITQNRGVEFVLDGVGLATYQVSMKCAKKRGYVILFGNASGAVPPLDPLLFTSNGSIFVTRPTLGDYILTREELQARFDDLLSITENKQLSFVISPSSFQLKDMQAAHQLIQDRSNVGKIVVRVDDKAD